MRSKHTYRLMYSGATVKAASADWLRDIMSRFDPEPEPTIPESVKPTSIGAGIGAGLGLGTAGGSKLLANNTQKKIYNLEGELAAIPTKRALGQEVVDDITKILSSRGDKLQQDYTISQLFKKMKEDMVVNNLRRTSLGGQLKVLSSAKKGLNRLSNRALIAAPILAAMGGGIGYLKHKAKQ